MTQTYYKFNAMGWFTGTENMLVARSTDIPIPDGDWSGEPIIEQYWPYWVETGWVLDKYKLPENVDSGEFGEWFSWSDFQRLFPISTRAAIFTSADGVIIAFVKLIESTGGCYIAHPETIAGIDYLVTATILSEEQGTAIKSGQAI